MKFNHDLIACGHGMGLPDHMKLTRNYLKDFKIKCMYSSYALPDWTSPNHLPPPQMHTYLDQTRGSTVCLHPSAQVFSIWPSLCFSDPYYGIISWHVRTRLCRYLWCCNVQAWPEQWKRAPLWVEPQLSDLPRYASVEWENGVGLDQGKEQKKNKCS